MCNQGYGRVKVNLVLQQQVEELQAGKNLPGPSVAQAALYHKVTALGQNSGLFHLSALPGIEDSCHFACLMNAPKVPSAATLSHEFLYLLHFVQNEEMETQRRETTCQGNESQPVEDTGVQNMFDLLHLAKLWLPSWGQAI